MMSIGDGIIFRVLCMQQWLINKKDQASIRGEWDDEIRREGGEIYKEIGREGGERDNEIGRKGGVREIRREEEEMDW